MHDLIRETSSLVNRPSKGRAPIYVVPLDLVEQILKSAITIVVKLSQVHLAYSLGSATPMSVDPKDLEIGSILNLLILER